MSKTGLQLLLACALSIPAIGAETKRMNVLLLIADDMNTWLLGDPNRYTGKVIAPNIRKLADSGVVFKRAYTAAPFCCPSRTATFSGVSPVKSGHYTNRSAWKKSEPLQKATSLAGVFKQAGYYTAGYGKITHGWKQADAWDERVGHRRDPIPPGAPLNGIGHGEHDWGPTHLKEEEMNFYQLADMTIKQLKKKHDKPFFLACGSFNPHMPWYMPQKYFDMFPLSEVKTPLLKSDDLDDVPPLARALTAGKSKFVKDVLAKGLHKEGVRGYLAATAYVDTHMGRILNALENSPYKDNTIVIMMSDHGFHLAEKSHWQKGTLWEEATHCLLMARVPGMTKAGGKCERFVSLQDLYPTLVDVCGLKAPDYLDGRSLVPLLKDPAAPWQSTAISALSSPGGPNAYVSIRTENSRYTSYADGQEELYDCTKDPHEWTNLIGNPEYKSVIDRHRQLIPRISARATPLPDPKAKK